MKKPNAGFTLLDALLGLVLLASGLVGMLYAFQGSISSSFLADQSVVAINLARQTLEKVSAQRDCNLSGCGYAATLVSITTNAYNQNPVPGFPGYTITTSAYEVNPGIGGLIDDFLSVLPGSGYMRITVVVRFMRPHFL